MTTSKNPWELSDDELLGGVSSLVSEPTPLKTLAPVAPVPVSTSMVSDWDAQDEFVSPAPILTPRIPTPTPKVEPALLEVTPKALEPEGMSRDLKLGIAAAGLAGVIAVGVSLSFWIASPKVPAVQPTMPAPAPAVSVVVPAPAPAVSIVVPAPAPAVSIVVPAPAPAVSVVVPAPAPAMEAPSPPMPALEAPAAPTPLSKPALPPELMVPTPPSAQDQVAQLPPPPPGASQTKKVATATPTRTVVKPGGAKSARKDEGPDGWDNAQRRMDDFLRQSNR